MKINPKTGKPYTAAEHVKNLDAILGGEAGDGGDGADPAEDSAGQLRMKEFIAGALGDGEAADIEDPADVAALPAWMEKNAAILEKATAAAKKAQKARSDKYGIAIKDGGSITMPSKWKKAGCTDDDFLDPVNYAYPCHDASHTRNAASRWEASKGEYSAKEQGIIEKRLETKRKKFDIGSEAKFKKVTDRAAVCGIAPRTEEPECPDEYQELADDPMRWGDFTNYRFPAGTEEQVQRSLTEVLTATDVEPSERGVIMSRLHSAYGMLAAEEAKKTLAALQAASGGDLDSIMAARGYERGADGVYAPKKDAGSNGTEPAKTDGSGDPAAAGEGTGGEVEKDFTYDTFWSMSQLCRNATDVLRGLDNLSEASGGDGLTEPVAGQVLDQLNAGLKAIVAEATAVAAETGDLTANPIDFGIVELDGLKLVERMKTAAPLLVEAFEKAGRRHSAADMKKLETAHDAVVGLGYSGCTPASTKDGLTTGAGTNPVAGGETEQMPAAAQERIKSLEMELQKARGTGDGSGNADLQQIKADNASLTERLEDAEDQLDSEKVARADLEEACVAKDGVIAQLENRLRAISRPDPMARKVSTAEGEIPEGGKPFHIEQGDGPRLQMPQEQTNMPPAHTRPSHHVR